MYQDFLEKNDIKKLQQKQGRLTKRVGPSSVDLLIKVDCFLERK
jgi:hypothetical protein